MANDNIKEKAIPDASLTEKNEKTKDIDEEIRDKNLDSVSGGNGMVFGGAIYNEPPADSGVIKR